MEKDRDFHIMIGEMHSDIKNILAQTQKTNGRVTALEEQMEEQEKWRSNVKGRFAAAYGVVSVIGVAAWEMLSSKIFK